MCAVWNFRQQKQDVGPHAMFVAHARMNLDMLRFSKRNIIAWFKHHVPDEQRLERFSACKKWAVDQRRKQKLLHRGMDKANAHE